jgi:transposase
MLMLQLTVESKIYVYVEPIDMRRSIDGLSVLLADSYQQNPQTGDLFIFTNKQRNKIKLLFWDRNDFALYYKKMERGRFCYSPRLAGEKLTISVSQLRALLMGLDFYLLGQYPQELCKDFF